MAKNKMTLRDNNMHGKISLKEILTLVGAVVLLLLVVSFFSVITEPSGLFKGTTECDDAKDNDGDGLRDRFDPGCIDRKDISEFGVAFCDNGLDDDADGFVDYPYDAGCTSSNDNNERSSVQCDNGLDDDGDGLIDQSDLDCVSPGDGNEAR